MIASLIFFITSLLIIGAAVKSYRNLSRWNGILLLAASAVYSVFCLMAFIKSIGVTPGQVFAQVMGQPHEPVILHPDIDMNSFSLYMTLTFCGGILVNVVTSIWVWLRGGLWKWCLTMAAAFCVVGACVGLLGGVSPIRSLFLFCCAFMAAVGWVLGLSYVEFCVIGNIWVPCAAFICTAVFLICASWRCLRACGGGVRILSVVSILIGLLTIVGSVMLLCHYAGTMQEAFNRCVGDLYSLSDMFGPSYQAVNLIIYVVGGVALLAYNIAVGRYLMKRSRP